MNEPACVVPAGDWTGEGAVWNADEKALYWVDINRCLIHRYDPEVRATWSWFFPEPPVALALTDRTDTILVAMASRIILWQPRNDARADFAIPERNWPHARLNDGGADPAGNFWVGSMQNNVMADGGDIPITDTAAGSLYRVTPDGSFTVEKRGIGISNTFGWSPDGARFYFGDTLRNAIYVWDFDLAAGTAANERPFFSGFSRGQPDGSAVDSAGFLWNARYGGGCIIRIAPDGSLDRVVDMPVDNITTCAFGGADLKTLYITTARSISGPRARLSGGLYALAVDAPGLPENHFRLGG